MSLLRALTLFIPRLTPFVYKSARNIKYVSLKIVQIVSLLGGIAVELGHNVLDSAKPNSDCRQKQLLFFLTWFCHGNGATSVNTE